MIRRFRYTRAAFVFLAPNRHWGSTGFYRKFPARKALQSPLGTRCTETKINMDLLDRHLKSRGHAASISFCFGGRRWYPPKFRSTCRPTSEGAGPGSNASAHERRTTKLGPASTTDRLVPDNREIHQLGCCCRPEVSPAEACCGRECSCGSSERPYRAATGQRDRCCLGRASVLWCPPRHRGNDQAQLYNHR